MPRFLNVHPLKGVDEETLRQLQSAPADEFEVKAVNLMYNREEDKFIVFLKHQINKQ